MTLVIITKVKLKQVKSSQLKWDPTGHPLWFNDLERDLYIIIGEDELRHFELSISSDLISGGASKALQYGRIKDDAGSRQDLSRLVDYKSEIPANFIDQAIELINDCEGIEISLKQGMIQYIKGFNFGRNPLRFEEPLKSYIPLENRSNIKKRIPLASKMRAFTKKLPRHLSLKFTAILIIAAIVSLYISMGNSLGNQFLEMDSRLNIAYINKYISNDGNIEVSDSLGKNILHRSASFLKTIDSEQYRAFEYLILSKNLDPNQFDLNGHTPLYYLIKSYLYPDLPKASSKSKAEELLREELQEKYLVIEKLLKIGLNSRLKKTSSDTSAWELARQDSDLRELLSKYR
jgi:hypothetical protein